MLIYELFLSSSVGIVLLNNQNEGLKALNLFDIQTISLCKQML